MASLTSTQKKLFESLRESKLHDLKTFNKRSYRGVWSSIIDKYPESAHFVYELLQNADDAVATEVQIVLKPELMLFKHNGCKHFNITPEDVEPVGDINSITGIGDSSKAEDTQNKIGKFGVGFKSVFQYTDTPEIYDDVFKFKIENYIVPCLLQSDHPWRNEGETLFVFPFKNATRSYKDILYRLENLQSPILFLHNLQRIVWRIDNDDRTGEEFEYSKKILDSVKYGDITMDYYVLSEPSQTSNVFLFSQKVDIAVYGKKAKHCINVGFYYDTNKKKLITDVTQNIYCFFPTKETFKTCFVSHAPFLLTDNRQNLKPNEHLNQDLLNRLANLAVKAILKLRDYGIAKKKLLIDENITEIIPSYERNYWGVYENKFEEPIVNAFENILYNERILLSRNEKYLSFQEAYMGSPKELVELLSQDQLVLLVREMNDEDEDENEGEDCLFDSQAVDFLKWELSQNIRNQGNRIYEDMKEFTSENFAECITTDFMSAQDMKWVSKMYTFLRTAAPKLWKLTDKEKNRSSYLPFRKAPIIKTQKGEWVQPFVGVVSPNVYLPLKDGNKSNYNFIAAEYLQNEMAKKFFSELDIKEPDESDYIREVILAKFKGEESDIDDTVLSSDFIVLLGYYQKVKDKSAGDDFIRQAKDKIYIVGKDGFLYRPSEMYFYCKNLEQYFAGREEIHYVDLEFYQSAIDEYGIEFLKAFITRLGVRLYPEIKQTTRWGMYSLSDRLKKQISTYDIQEYHLKDFELHGFKELVNNKIPKEVSYYIWNVMLPSLRFADYESLTMIYRRKYARSTSSMIYPSTFKDSLQHEKWIFSKGGVLYSPDKIALEDLSPEYNLHNGLIQFLNIEKREKSIIELGGTKEQQEQLDLGKRVRQIVGDDFTDEEIYQALANLRAQKKVQKHETCNPEITPNAEDLISTTKRNNTEHKTHEYRDPEHSIGANSPDGMADDDETQDSYTEETVFRRDELRQTKLTEMFVDSKRVPTSPKEKKKTDEEQADELMQKLIEQEEMQNKIKELRETAQNAERYSKEWFETLIELEYRGGTGESNGNLSKSIHITFSSVTKERGSERIYVLRNPSRTIPLWLEEIGDIEIKCAFSNRDELKLKFEVANVHENSLRLKASKAYESVLNRVEWNKCTTASITLKNQIDLMGKVRSAFNGLELEAGFNLKDNLSDNLKFIFGPPGTGKTTTLAKQIIDLISKPSRCRILVLAPTNTACDELARKVREYSQNNCPWLYRFVSSADEKLEDIVIDRESMVYDKEKCCIISTMARLSFDGFNGVGGYNKLLDIVWDVVICDEASMISLAEMALTIYNFVNTPIVIAGDPMQIKPILHEDEWKDENIYTMVRLDRFDSPVTEPIQFDIQNLTTQYRSVPAIGELFNRYAYDGKLLHYRSSINTGIKFGNLELKPVNFIPFKVERYDSVFGIKKLDGSNVHIYSVLLTLEIVKYIVREYAKENDKEYSIGVVCPYSPQAQLIESLIMQMPNIPDNITVTVGTVHRFQGGQCNFMFVVLNPPAGMKIASDRIFLNNKNILNVAISRAQDYLCILLPHRDTDGYENLYEINKIGRIAMQNPISVAHYTSDQIEEIIFGHKFFIENNTFVTSHQLANVYTKAVKRYEVRIDEKSVDIQLGSKGKQISDIGQENSKNEQLRESLLPQSKSDVATHIEDESPQEYGATLVPSGDGEQKIQYTQQDIITAKTFTDAEQFYTHIREQHLNEKLAVELLIKTNTMCSMFVLVQVLGDIEHRERFGWKTYEPISVKLFKDLVKQYDLFNKLYPLLFVVLREQKVPIKKIGHLRVSDLSQKAFERELTAYIQRLSSKSSKRSKPKSSQRTSSIPYRTISEKESKPYIDFEYGLSDW